MSGLSELLGVKTIFLDISTKDVEELFNIAGQHFAEITNIPTKEISQCLSDREKLGSTGLGVGVAIPHGRVKGLKSPLAGFYRLSQPIDFKAPDNEKVDIAIILLVPEQATQKHLDLLSEIAQLLSDGARRDVLRQEASAEALLATLTQQAA
jgi:PTS system nitrogen regulatory IIA component